MSLPSYRQGRIRGQSLVLFCFGLMLLTLMVLLTLSISARVKDRIELQSVADAAAYSEAVVTARAFNSISLLNRSQVSHMVALSAVQSLISWSGYAKATLAGTEEALNSMRSDKKGCPGPGCGCNDGDIDAALSALAAHKAKVQAQWGPLDDRAGDQQRTLQGIAGVPFESQKKMLVEYARARIEGHNGQQSLAEKIARDVRAGSPWRGEAGELYVDKGVMAKTGYPSQQEMRRAVSNYGTGGKFPFKRTNNEYSVQATMGSRLDPFVTSRAGGGGALSSMLNRLIGSAGFSSSVSNVGSGYFSGGPGMAHGVKGKEGGGYGWGDDHDGTVSLQRAQGGACKTSGSRSGLTAHLYGSDAHEPDDRHGWSPSWGGDADAVKRHTYGPCATGRHGVWPFGMDYNEASVADANDLFGQPKNVVVVMRDFSAREQRPDPWALRFNYKFGAQTGTDFDLRKQNLAAAAKIQAAVATGIVYYHRGTGDGAYTWEHWKEPPNFFNPFWRATLIATDADERAANGRQRGQAAATALQQHGLAGHADIIRLLRNEGFEGFQ